MIGNVVAGVALAKLIYELVVNRDTARIESDKIFVNYLVEDPKQSFGVLKGMMTRRVNKIVDGSLRFKIGKTGAPEGRISKYYDYTAMYLLCQSSDIGLIESLECYLNDKYCGYDNCDNVKGGSAGMMTNRHNQYFLYLVIE